jgi:hypothetical protein
MEPLVVRLSDSVTIIHGDCRDVLPVACDAVVTDPPYGINHKAPTGHHKLGHLGNRKLIHGDAIPFDPSWIIDAFLKPTGGNGGQKPIILWGANHYANRLPDGQWLCWDKACGKGPHSSFQDAEFAWSSRKTPRCIFHHLWLGLLREGEDASGRARRKHPSQKTGRTNVMVFGDCKNWARKDCIRPVHGKRYDRHRMHSHGAAVHRGRDGQGILRDSAGAAGKRTIESRRFHQRRSQ